MSAVVSRMSDRTIARFVARNVIAESSSTDRLAQAFQTLVRDEGDERQRLLALAHEDVAASPLGSTEGFEAVWDHVAREAAHLLLRQAVRVRRVRPRAVGRADAGD